MADLTLALNEQLLQDAIPRKTRCGGKTLLLLFLLIGLMKLTVLSWTTLPSDELKEPSITMVLQPSRTLQFPQSARVLPFSQTARARQFMSPKPAEQPLQRLPYWTTAAAVNDRAVSSQAPEPLALLKKKFKPFSDLMKKYGAFALGFHFTVWSLTLGTSFILLSLGLSIESYLPAALASMLPAGSGNLAAAYILTEATGPVRTLFTLTTVPVLGNVFELPRQEAQGMTDYK